MSSVRTWSALTRASASSVEIVPSFTRSTAMRMAAAGARAAVRVCSR